MISDLSVLKIGNTAGIATICNGTELAVKPEPTYGYAIKLAISVYSWNKYESGGHLNKGFLKPFLDYYALQWVIIPIKSRKGTII